MVIDMTRAVRFENAEILRANDGRIAHLDGVLESGGQAAEEGIELRQKSGGLQTRPLKFEDEGPCVRGKCLSKRREHLIEKVVGVQKSWIGPGLAAIAKARRKFRYRNFFPDFGADVEAVGNERCIVREL